MKLDGFFRKALNELEIGGRTKRVRGKEYTELTRPCPKCTRLNSEMELAEQLGVCTCGYHFRQNARQRIAYLADAGTFTELDAELESKDLLEFPGYPEKLASAKLASSEKEAVITGICEIGGTKVCLFIMEPYFMMGSMGTIVGEKITRLFETATRDGLPVIGYTVSGGARMQEGILSLMQMAKISGAVGRHSAAGLFYTVVLTDPTTGGVTASFAMEGDVILAEPGALIGFAGQRVIEQTIRKKLPGDFQRAEFLLDHGFVDAIAPRREQKAQITALLGLHKREVSA
ncbi:MAG: acetyl-CoA carboxylase, carboxyltransferase subunit beta [Oscillospiraceae bacterium]|nr:acetyl-CoA carboxylase, carboxyltransferase subunit beta [Oscillospiraceae bacterium]